MKITEALTKGVPVVAYKAGGIPLQIQHGYNGFLVPVGKIDQVANYLQKLCIDDQFHATMAQNARQSVTEEYWTVWNAISWLWMFKRLCMPESISKDIITVETDEGFSWVKDEWHRYFGLECDGK